MIHIPIIDTFAGPYEGLWTLFRPPRRCLAVGPNVVALPAKSDLTYKVLADEAVSGVSGS